MAKKATVYCLDLDGIKAIHFSIEDLCEALKYEFIDQEFEDIKDQEFKVSALEMTEKQIEDLPEFDGF